MSVRLLIQPLMASVLAIRAGLRDTREHRPPFFWATVFDADRRDEMLRQGWKDIGIVFVAAVGLDIVFQLMTTRGVHFGLALPLAIMVALIPYLMLRAIVGRIAYICGARR